MEPNVFDYDATEPGSASTVVDDPESTVADPDTGPGPLDGGESTVPESWDVGSTSPEPGEPNTGDLGPATDLASDDLIDPSAVTGADSRDATTLSLPGNHAADRLDFALRPTVWGWLDVPGFAHVSFLGKGGMGVVFKARDVKLDRLVALKVIKSGVHANPEERRRFEGEAKIIAGLSHRNVVQIYHVGAVGGVPYLVLELLEGGTLAQRLAGAPQPQDEAAALLVTLAEAVHAAHRAKVVHRDLKPLNILFDVDGVPKVADFGLAKRLEAEEGQTVTGQVMGTASYMAPEQALGRVHEIGPAVDIYALGAILYEMLTGRPPYKGVTSQETLLLVLREDPVPPSRVRAQLAFDLETICLKCLARDPRQRYHDARELAEDLKRFLAREPILGRRPPFRERAWRWAGKHPVTVVLLAVFLALTTGGVAAAVRAEQGATARLGRLRNEVTPALFDAQRALDLGRWDDVREIVSGQFSKVEHEPRLADLRDRAEQLRLQAQAGQGEQRAAEETRRRLERFRAVRARALYLDSGFSAVGPPAPPATIVQTARDGLREFMTAARGDEWAPVDPPPALSDQEQAEVGRGCHELLLILADAVARSPGAAEVDRADQALAVLDRADVLRRPPGRASLLLRADCLARKGDETGTIRARKAADRTAPADAFDFFLDGRARFKRKDWSAAAEDFGSALQLRPDHFWAQCLLAICRMQTGEPYQAVHCLTACLQRQPDAVWLYLLRGLASAESGKLGRQLALGLPARAEELRRGAARLFQDAEADYRTALERLGTGPEDDRLRYVLLVNRGLIGYESNDLAAAAADLRAAIRLNDRDYAPHLTLGLVYQRQGRTDDALAQFGHAIRLQPKECRLYRARADVYLGLKERTASQRAAALNDLETAIRLESAGKRQEIAGDWANQARLLLEDGAHDAEALAASEEALSFEPGLETAHRYKIRALLALKRHADLIGACDAALKFIKEAADLYELCGLAHQELGDYSRAIADYTHALSLRPEDARLLSRRGWSYLLYDAPLPALDDFDAALKRAPGDLDARGGRGSARAVLGQHRGAATDAESLFLNGPATPRTAHIAARIYAQAAAWIHTHSGPDAARLVELYRLRAVALLGEALQRLPSARRAEFLNETISKDPALRSIPPRMLRGLEKDAGAKPAPR